MCAIFAAGLSRSSDQCKLLFHRFGNDIDINGAIGDLTPNSKFLQSLKKTLDTGSAAYYKHAIAGLLSVSDAAAASAAVNSLASSPALLSCYTVFNPLPPHFSFDEYFGGNADLFGGANDLIVSETSQLGPFIPPVGESTVDVAHLHVAIPLMPLLQFPGALDANRGNVAKAVKLLNSPASAGSFLH